MKTKSDSLLVTLFAIAVVAYGVMSSNYILILITVIIYLAVRSDKNKNKK